MYLVGLFLFVTSLATAGGCKPTVNPQQDQYLIGYGSLINHASKRRTDPEAQPSVPVLVHGFKRTWIIRSERRKITYLGCRAQSV